MAKLSVSKAKYKAQSTKHVFCLLSFRANGFGKDSTRARHARLSAR